MFCRHQWKTTKRASYPIYPRRPYPTFYSQADKPIDYKVVAYQQCKKCGKENIRRV